MTDQEPLDSLGMFAAAASLPEQLAVATASADLVGSGGLPSHDDIENVVVLGVGGSGVAGDVVTVVAGPFMAVPVVVHKSYGIPNFISDKTLVFAISFSGNTEETLEAATEAAMAGAKIVCISHGGELESLAGEWSAPHIPIADGIPTPRSGIGALCAPPLVLLEHVGLFPGAAAWIDAAVAQLTRRRDELIVPGNPAELLARRIGRTMPLIYGGGAIGQVAALRWKTQFNENAKTPAFANVMPELCHNEVCGFGQNGDITRQVMHLVNLRHEFEHPQVARRFDLVNEAISEVVADIDTVVAAGDGALAQLLDLVIIGDFMSLHRAAQEGLDPGPVPVLDEIKAALAIAEPAPPTTEHA